MGLRLLRTGSAVVLCCLALAVDSSLAEELTPKELMRRVNRANRTNDARRELTMTLVSNKGSERKRKVVTWRKKLSEELDKTLVRFLSPGDIAGTGLLTIEKEGMDDDQWLYLPALKKTRRISAADRTDSFMGTDFTYEDMSPLKLEEYDYKDKGTEKIEEVVCRVIEMIPSTDKRRREGGYARTVSWVDPRQLVARRVDFYDLQNVLSKTLTLAKINKHGDVYMADQMEMTTLKTGHVTTLLYEKTELDVGLEDDLFTERELMRGR
ncbi:MAG: outer membrane lipoprotein-sorting protein [Candidatus Schekmanbacteria bacterium]|nr:outer membrane lipoprotein-sorting protein [Candidatus Schekmanbacteria bacterium]